MTHRPFRRLVLSIALARLEVGGRPAGRSSGPGALRARFAGVALFAALFLPLLAAGEGGLTIGTACHGPADAQGTETPAGTYVNLSRPANADGFLRQVRLEWSEKPCPNALQVAVFSRRGHKLTRKAIRGPFSIPSFDVTLEIDPPIEVEEGDLLGYIYRATGCGHGPYVPDDHALFAAVAGEPESFDPWANGTLKAGELAISGTGDATLRTAVIVPVVCDADGRAGAHFRSELFILPLYLGGEWESAATLLFCPEGDSSRENCASRSLTLGGGETIQIENVPGLFERSGVGTVEVRLPAVAHTPIVRSRIVTTTGSPWNPSTLVETADPSQGAAGTFPLLGYGAEIFFNGPRIHASERANIGIRTVEQDCEIEFSVFRRGIGAVSLGRRRFPARTLVQLSWSEIFGQHLTEDGDGLFLDVVEGAAYTYCSVVENATNFATFVVGKRDESFRRYVPCAAPTAAD